MATRLRLGAWLLVAGALGSCKSDRQDRPPESPAASPAAVPAAITVTATDFALDLPATVPAGAVTMKLVNQGKELHQAQVIRLDDGKTIDDFMAAMKEHGPPPSWVRFLGGPNAVVPEQETAATSVLTPGNHLVLCFIPSPDGISHLAKGMIRPFEVTESGASAAELPEAGDTIKLTDYDFEPTHPLRAGRRTILVENEGPQPHELVLVKLAPGKTVQDFAVWAEGGLQGPPPAMPLGGVVFLDQGGRGQFTADLTPGEYGFICFVPDAKDGKPHLAHGMMKQIKVES